MAKTASILGDHIEQQYPWTYLLATSIKNFEFPWWTNLIHCGFPIIAEGQIGAFYPPNLILCFLLPLKWAYSYMNVVHFFVSGCGTYLYARLMKLGSLSAFVTSLVFLFGSAYGGAYYNLISLKTIAWFPVSLFLFEKFYQNGKLRYLISLSCSIALSLLAGYLQVAVLALLIFSLYASLRIFIFCDESKRSFRSRLKKSLILLGAVAFSLLLAFPQLFLTFQLALFSNRTGLTEDYAYVGSLSPFSLLTFFFMGMQGIVRGHSLYGGVMTVFFILYAFFSRNVRSTVLFKIWCLLGLIAFFLALGRWSPLYIAMIKLTHFYSFRMPAKFLVFVCFSASMLTGMGVDAVLQSASPRRNSFAATKAAGVFLALLLAAFAMKGLLYYLLVFARPLVLNVAEWFVFSFIYGKAGHPYPLHIYLERLQGPGNALDHIQSVLSFGNVWNLWAYVFFMGSCILVFSSIRFRTVNRRWLSFALFFLFIDLYVFSWRDINRDFGPYARADQPSRVADFLREEQKDGKLGRLFGFRDASETLPILPSANMLYGFEDIGAYSPLVMKRYHETIGLFGNINDSNFAFTPTFDFLEKHFKLLNILDVSHILSKRSLSHPKLKLLIYDEESKTFLYRNQDVHVRAFFVSKLEAFSSWEQLKRRLLQPGFDPRGTMLLERSEIGRIKPIENSFHDDHPNAILMRGQHTFNYEVWTADVNQSGFFVLSNTMYPGWTATLNGKKVPVLKAYGLFQAVWLDAGGKYEIKLNFNPLHFRVNDFNARS